MADLRLIANQLSDTDVAFLVNAYDMTETDVKSYNDVNWCDFFGCTIEELPYYLFDGDSPVVTSIESGDFGYDNDDDFAFDQDSLFSIDQLIEEEIMRTSTPTYKPATKAFTSEYSRPSAFAHTRKPSISVPHHFELVK